ncbi:Metal tolerance protein C4 [Quillaja saponaria]|uniref:Metal tolerance protein C4 n=1 Tax=Quillaja saponaria TaxID=32244 RepID=A0AAD7PE01_QUISA|nr:Metal tolerance protein C4 [Quillaja saponaria]
MRTSYHLLSRFHCSQKYLSSSSSIAKPSLRFSNLSQLLLFHSWDHKPTQQASSTPQLGQNSELPVVFPAPICSNRFVLLRLLASDSHYRLHHHYSSHRNFFTRAKQVKNIEINDCHSQRAVTTALWCNFLVFSLKFGVWLATTSHVILAEVVHSLADFANQALLAYGLSSSRRAPDAIHPYGYSKERFVWSLISAVGIFCLGSGATVVHGFQNLWTSQPPENIKLAALVIGVSFIIEGASLLVAIQAVKKGAAAEGMKVRDYVWRGHDPTSVAVMTEDGAAVTGLVIAAASLVAVNITGNAIYDPIGSIIVGNLLGMVAIFLIQRNRHSLIGRAMDDHDMQKVLHFLKNDLVVDALYDCKSEVIGPGFFRFKAEIDFNGVVVVQNYLDRTGREEWARQFREAAEVKDDTALLKIMSNYGEEVVTALGSEVDRLEQEIQDLVPGIRHVDIEAHNPIDAATGVETIFNTKA